MQNLIEWMAKFTFELTWEDIGMPPLEEREEEEEAMFGYSIFFYTKSRISLLQNEHPKTIILNHRNLLEK